MPPAAAVRVPAPTLARRLGRWQRPGPAYLALSDAVRLLVCDGRLPLGSRLPGERELAGALGLSRTTVTAAYARLREEGYLDSRQGSGSTVTVPVGPAGTRPGGTGPGGNGLSGTGPSGTGEPFPPLDEGRGDGVVDLTCAALPALPGVYRAFESALRRMAPRLAGPGYESLGVAELRAVVAERYTRRGLPTTPDQVLVTSGVQHAMALVAATLLGPGDRVLVEQPTYPGVLAAVRAVPARPVAVPVDRDGWDLPLLEATLRQAAPRLAVLVADFHNPTGACLDAAGRERVAAAALGARTPLVVDETLADLWLEAPPPPPVAACAGGAAGRNVVTLGGVDKSHWGGLRVGWVRADAALVQRLAAARAARDLGTPVLEQLAVAELLAPTSDEPAGTGAPGLDQRREAVRGQRDALAAALARALPAWSWRLPPGGLSLWVELDRPVSSALAGLAPAHGLRLAAGPRFGVDGGLERFLRLPFGLPVDALELAVERLAAMDRSLDGRPVVAAGDAALVVA